MRGPCAGPAWFRAICVAPLPLLCSALAPVATQAPQPWGGGAEEEPSDSGALICRRPGGPGLSRHLPGPAEGCGPQLRGGRHRTAGQPALRRRPPLCCCRPHPHAAAKQAGRACPRAAPSGQLTAGRQTRGGKSGRAPRDGAVANSSHREGTSVLAPRESKSAVSRYPREPVLMPATQAVGTLRHTGPQTHPARP